jgi:hypothetical protein
LAAANASATPVETGSTVDEPETLIEPVTVPPPPCEAGAALAGAALAAAEAAVEGAVEPPVEEHAPMAKAATRASAPRRFGLVMITRCSSFDATPIGGEHPSLWGGRPCRTVPIVRSGHQRRLFDALRLR